jgi:hypothetical protein
VTGLITLLPFIPLVFVGAAVAAMKAQARRRDRAFAAFFAADPDFEELDTGANDVMGARTRRGPAGAVVATGATQAREPAWQASVSVPRVGARTSLKLHREGLAGALRERFGHADIHTGDDAFDRAFFLAGTDEDVVRGLFREPGVREAARALFADPLVRTFEVQSGGGACLEVIRRDDEPRSAREVLVAALAFAAVLEAHADTAPVPASAVWSGKDGVGGVSGAPIAISSGARR